MRTHCLRLVGTASVLFSGFSLTAEDWTNYRGPTHNGESIEQIRTNWTEQTPAQLWKVSIGPALSSMTIKDGRVFTMERQGNTINGREFCVALDAATGTRLWERDIDLADYPHAGVGGDDGPRSTPVVEGDRVFVLGSYLQLVCLNASDGTEIWRRDLPTDYGVGVISWQSAGSPLVYHDKIYLAASSSGDNLFAFDKSDGSLAWRANTDRMTQATPIPATIHGVPQVVFFTQTGLVSVHPDTGAALWRFSHSYSTSSAASPIIDGDRVYCSAAYGRGASVGVVSENEGVFSVSDLWRRPGDHQNHWGTPIVHDGYLYGPYGQSNPVLECIDLGTGESQWSESGIGYGSVLKVGNNLLALHANGTMVLVELNSTEYREIDRFQPLSGKCWNNPAISDGVLYVRSTLEVAAFDVALPMLEFSSTAGSMTPQGFQLTIKSSNDAPIDSGRADNVSIFHSPSPDVPAPNWTLLNRPYSLSDGNMIVTDPDANGTASRFYRAEENE